jgi:hypothetical protein
MPYNEGLLNTYSANAGVDLSGKQFCGVTLVNDPTGIPPGGVKLVVGTVGKAIAGVLQNNPLMGQAGCYQPSGITKVAISANQTIVGGTTLLDLDFGGTFAAHTTGTIVAEALESVAPVATIQIISARLLPSNSPTA